VSTVDVAVPEHSAAASPPERRGGARDGVRLMVAEAGPGTITHTTFAGMGAFLEPGDVLVLNVSATIPASVDGLRADGERVRLHLSSPVAGDLWTVEPRRPRDIGSDPWRDFDGGPVALPGGAGAMMLAQDSRSPRLWVAELRGITDPVAYMRRHGVPIRYTHVDRAWPLQDYQTVYASEPGSAEMPSAGRPFTPELITALVAAGVLFAPVVLHSGVASFEAGELPDSERFRVPETTARVINEARAARRRAIAVGTTTVRAVETMTDSSGIVHPGSGVTDLLVTPERGVRAVDGIVTGWHEAGVSHLALVEAVGTGELVARCYAEAATGGYLWHEFGDSLLLLRR
jgi:S-adenosylmethionine:tRNA ribosyltransferase-isomerase